ncbi:hypothetical protein FRC06_001448 [Ceratobasidium sp. 370]|nr:hypothetical protein FRC06_001448 [Ceratobasidium sp. 370]
MRQMLDPSLQGTMQHHWLRKHSNIKPEILWSQFRRRAAPGLEDLMQQGVEHDWYDPFSNIEMLTFRFVFMPLIQQELNLFVEQYNTSTKCSNTKTSLPAGRPKYIHLHPHQYDGKQLKVEVPQEAVEHVRALYAPPDHPVFHWIPPQFELHACNFYQHVGGGTIVRDNAWSYYRAILDSFRQVYSGNVLHRELDSQGDIQSGLLELSDTGSHRGDAWGYDEVLNENVGLIGPVGDEEFQFDDDDTLVVEFSDEETIGNVGDGVF